MMATALAGTPNSERSLIRERICSVIERPDQK
jgi:hypothetical protein